MTAEQLRDAKLDDNGWKAAMSQVTDAKEALRIIVDSSTFLGGDPYYNDLVGAMIDMADRLGAASV